MEYLNKKYILFQININCVNLNIFVIIYLFLKILFLN